MNNINPIYNINNAYLPAFKQKAEHNSIITNPINTSVSMRGVDALANYNKGTIPTITNKLDIPILSPVDIPGNADDIQGEKIFDNDTGEITVIQKGDNNTKRYIYENNGSYTYEIYDNKDNLLFTQSKNITNNGIYTKIIEERPDNDKIKGAQALYKDGTLVHASKYTIPPKESSEGYPYEDIGYNNTSKTYYIEKCDSNNNALIQYFDSNLKPISESEYKIRTLVSDDNYMEDTHKVQMKRDTNNDGEVSVDETLANDYLMNKYPDLGQEDREALIKYAMLDGNINVSDEEFVRWLEGPEHSKILDEFKLRESDEIRMKRNSSTEEN